MVCSTSGKACGVSFDVLLVQRGFPNKEEYSDFADSIVKDLNVEILDDEAEVQKTEGLEDIDDAGYTLINYNYPVESENGGEVT